MSELIGGKPVEGEIFGLPWPTPSHREGPVTPFDHENGFYLSATPTRLAKLLAQYEAFKLTLDIPGAIIEAGVFKGASFSRLALLRQLHCNPVAKELIGFDTFDTYAPATTERDMALREAVVAAAGDRAISTDALRSSLYERGLGVNVLLVAGDICETVPRVVSIRPELKVSFLNLDVDFEPAAALALEYLWPRVSHGGVVLLDDYGTFEGETRAVDEYFGGRAKIRRLPIAYSPCYLVKE